MTDYSYFFSYLATVIKFAPGRFALGCVLILSNAVFSGAGLLLLVPILHYTGWLPVEAHIGGLGYFLNQWIPFSTKLPLPLTLGVFVMVIAISAAFDFLCRKQTQALRLDYTLHLQRELNRSIAQAKWSYVLSRKLQDANHLMSIGVGQAVLLTHFSFVLITEVVLVTVFFGISCILSWRLALLAATLSLIPFLFSYKKRSKSIGEQHFRITQRTHESLAKFLEGVKVAKSYNLIERYTKHFESLVQENHVNQKGYVHAESAHRFFSLTSGAVIFSLIFYFAVNVFKIHPVTLVTLVVVFSRLMPRVMTLQSTYLRVVNVLPVFYQFQKMIREYADHREVLETGTLPPLAYQLRFENVSFGYNHNLVLKNISCHIPFNSTTAIVGPSGAGKTTFADLLLGLISPQSGKIYLDNVEFSPSMVSQWRDLVSYVPQEPYLFNDTIRANLQWAAPEASDETIWNTLQIAAADEFVRKLPLGIESKIGDRGTHLSGGERQRLALARALLRNPKILLLDESTSALDSASEELIQGALKKLSGKLTIIVIAHRLSSIRYAENVLVLKDGMLIESGPTAQLSADPLSTFSRHFSVQAFT